MGVAFQSLDPKAWIFSVQGAGGNYETWSTTSYSAAVVAEAEMTLPNSFHVLPSNFSSCICLTGAKSVGLVEIVMPGRSIGRAKLCKLAACFHDVLAS